MKDFEDGALTSPNYETGSIFKVIKLEPFSNFLKGKECSDYEKTLLTHKLLCYVTRLTNLLPVGRYEERHLE